jgi:hypothetical protein
MEADSYMNEFKIKGSDPNDDFGYYGPIGVNENIFQDAFRQTGETGDTGATGPTGPTGPTATIIYPQPPKAA